MQVTYDSASTHANHLVYLNVRFGVEILIRKLPIDRWVEAEAFRSIWHSEDRASWYILIIKPTRCNYSQIYFWNRTLHVSDRFSVHHQESACKQSAKPVWHIPIAECTVRDSWWWTENLSESGLQSALNLHTVRLFTEGDYPRGCGDTICPPEDEQGAARNMLRIVV